MVRTEEDIRQMLKIVGWFGDAKAVQALQWVLGEYPPDKLDRAERGKKEPCSPGWHKFIGDPQQLRPDTACIRCGFSRDEIDRLRVSEPTPETSTKPKGNV